jgi:hypothetical protein
MHVLHISRKMEGKLQSLVIAKYMHMHLSTR